MKFKHHFTVNAPLTRVSEFHSRSVNMPKLTPPPMRTQLLNASEILKAGDDMDFNLILGPIKIHWVAHLELLSLEGFTDRQLIGPFKEWVHQHHFTSVNETTTLVLDDIDVRLRKHPLWWIVGMGMYLTLPILFTFRKWKTRRLLA
jgi:ligand-binding SRPBCC domain-containing protein